MGAPGAVSIARSGASLGRAGFAGAHRLPTKLPQGKGSGDAPPERRLAATATGGMRGLVSRGGGLLLRDAYFPTYLLLCDLARPGIDWVFELKNPIRIEYI